MKKVIIEYGTPVEFPVACQAAPNNTNTKTFIAVQAASTTSWNLYLKSTIRLRFATAKTIRKK